MGLAPWRCKKAESTGRIDATAWLVSEGTHRLDISGSYTTDRKAKTAP
jgi:hypothetical protein